MKTWPKVCCKLYPGPFSSPALGPTFQMADSGDIWKYLSTISTYDWGLYVKYSRTMCHIITSDKDLLPTSLKFLCCGESLFYLFDSKHENVVINYHYNCSSWNEKWWFVFHFSANVFSPEVILDKYLFRAHVFWNKAESAHYRVNIYQGNF